MLSTAPSFMSPFTWWKAVPCRRVPLTSMLYFAIQPALWRGFVVLFIETPFFDLHHCYRILTVSHFQFTCYLLDLDSLPFSIYKLLTVSLFYLHVIYRILTVSLFQFTCYVQDLDSLPFLIYLLFTGSWWSLFLNLHVIYRILTVSLFRFTCY